MFTLVLGGARSGKSRYAQSLCEAAGAVVFIATARTDGGDDEMRARITRHRADRPAAWRTVEEPLELERVLEQAEPAEATILVDCVTVWLANLAWEYRDSSPDDAERAAFARVAAFARLARSRRVVAVSNEVGSGIVPEHPIGRSFRDLQGLANQLLAREAERVVLMVAGLPLLLKGGGERRSSLDAE
jgi:adenosylcobinamide kinase/adenosylcobinamide-phosphate guanylyltransferase